MSGIKLLQVFAILKLFGHLLTNLINLTRCRGAFAPKNDQVNKLKSLTILTKKAFLIRIKTFEVSSVKKILSLLI
jgi:hypothetical protein